MSSEARSQSAASWISSIPVAVISISIAISCFKSIGGSDWHNYLWAANTALNGRNPYVEWAQAISSLPSDNWPGRADLPPLQLLIYMACLWLGGPQILFSLFAITHTATAVIINQVGERSKRHGLMWLAYFWSAFPLITQWFFLQASNKNIMTLLAVMVVLCACRADRFRLLNDKKGADTWIWLALLVAAFLGNFGWLGFAAVPTLILSSGWPVRKMVLGVVAVFFISILLHLPYAPDWSVMYSFRFSRVVGSSFHTSPLRFVELLLDVFGIHMSLQLPLLFSAMTALCFNAYRHPFNAGKSSALAMIAMGTLRTDTDPPTILMSLVIALVALNNAGEKIYISVIVLLFYTYVTTAVSGYGTLLYAFYVVVPLLLPVGLLVKELIQDGSRARDGLIFY